tara:strand:+ start:100 stop:420 length:321 start_codon:yes stop_codon:yes gene_type:complete
MKNITINNRTFKSSLVYNLVDKLEDLIQDIYKLDDEMEDAGFNDIINELGAPSCTCCDGTSTEQALGEIYNAAVPMHCTILKLKRILEGTDVVPSTLADAASALLK